jgi:STE24 endopeptidase
MRKFLLGVAAGIAAGYAAYRAYESFGVLTRPIATREPDAAAYGATRRAFAVAGIIRSVAAAASAAYGPAGERLERSVQRLPVWLRPMAFAGGALLSDALLELPIDIAEGYGLEHRYGLSDQSASSWFSDRIKEEAIGGAVAIALSGIFAAALRRWPTRWPFVASAGVLPLLVLANIVVPVYIMPLFNEYRPIEGALEKRLRALAARYGVGDAEILRVDMSKQTKKANAFVVGIGKTHRIVVGDTLIEHFPEDEIAFVVAHELGHYVSKDSWRLIVVSEALAVAVLLGAFFALGERGRSEVDKPTALARIQWWTLFFSTLLRPAISAYSRSREWAADRFALSATQAPLIGASAFKRLGDQNLSEDEQPAWFEFFFSTHPSLRARIEALQKSLHRTANTL